MIILGIDPGSRKAGFALIRVQGKKIDYIDSGVLRYDGEKEFLDRLGLIYDSCRDLVNMHEPNEVAIESLIYVKSVTSLAKLAQARGAMVAAFMATHQKKVSEYSPNLIKSTVTGHGHATKESVDKSLQMIFGKNIEFKTHDESDALAIAVCHALLRDAKVPNTKGVKTNRGRSLKQAFKHLE